MKFRNNLVIFIVTILIILLIHENYLCFASTIAKDNLSNALTFKKNYAPIDFKANNIQYNQNLGLIIATGNVLISQNNQTVRADKVYIEKNKNLIIAKGNVYYKNQYQQKIFGDEVEIKNNFSTMILNRISLLFPDNSLLTACRVVKTNNISETYNSAYTTCKFSEFFSPFWSIKAAKIIYNKDKDILTIYNAWFTIKNTPILWIPYASYADPSRKRKFGFLLPNVGSITSLGYFITTPIFFPITDYTDLTITPTFFQLSNPMVSMYLSSYIPYGDLSLNGSFTKINNTINWHIFSNLKKEFSNKTRLTINFNDAYSKEYLNLYPIKNYINNLPFLYQNVSLETFFSSSSYLNIYLDTSKNLSYLNDHLNNPYLLPEINYLYLGQENSYGQINLSLQYNNFINNSSSINNINFDFNKLATVISHTFSKITPIGVFTENSSLQNVNYYKIYTNNTINNKNLLDSYTGANVSLKAEYPFFNNTGSYNNIINPILQLSYSDILLPKINHLAYLDQNTLNINYLSLFENNKYNGFDYFEKGARLNYGLSWDLISLQGFNGNMLIGQSISLTTNNKSNYLIYLSATPSRYLSFSYEGIFNPKTDFFEQNTLTGFLGNNLLGVNFTYSSKTNLDQSIYSNTSLEELSTEIYAQVNENIRINTITTFDLKNTFNSDIKITNRLNSIEAQLLWQNNCIAFILDVQRNYYSDANIRPNTKYSFRIVLKNLVGFSIGSRNSNIKNILN